ncbi:hypothetical protein MRX96_055292 [Rhipicephalus microplus]
MDKQAPNSDSVLLGSVHFRGSPSVPQVPPGLAWCELFSRYITWTHVWYADETAHAAKLLLFLYRFSLGYTVPDSESGIACQLIVLGHGDADAAFKLGAIMLPRTASLPGSFAGSLANSLQLTSVIRNG